MTEAARMSAGALSGIRVIDLSRLLPGPYCSMMLGDLGAEVIKIEEPGVGDPLRTWPPKLEREGAYFLALNRNKKSLTLNLKSTRGKEILIDLAKKSDVVLEGFRPGVMDKLGLGYNDLKKVNPRIIVCSISGYGQDDPWVKKAGHDVNCLSIAGLEAFTGTKEGKPIIPGTQIADIGGGGMLAAFCILAAIIAREKSGTGQYIDIAMLDGALASSVFSVAKYFVDGKNPKPANELLTGRFACYNIYRTKDGRYMSLGALEPKFWSAFCNAIGREELIKDQFTAGRKAEELISEIEKVFLERTRDEWVELLKNVDCCCEPVNNFDEAFSHPQVVSRNMVAEIEHSAEGKIRLMNFPGKFSETPATIKSVAPTLGEHTKEILRELGVTDQEIKELEREKNI